MPLFGDSGSTCGEKAMGEALRLGFERRLKLEFHGSKVLGTPYLIPPSFRLGAALLRLKRAFQGSLQSPMCQEFSKVSPELLDAGG